MGSMSGSVGDGRRSGGGCVSGIVWGGAANLRRNLQFRSVARPEPDNLIQYWSNCFTSVTIPNCFTSVTIPTGGGQGQSEFGSPIRWSGSPSKPCFISWTLDNRRAAHYGPHPQW